MKLVVLCDAKQEADIRLNILRNRGVRLWDEALSDPTQVHCEVVIGNEAFDQIESFIKLCPQATFVLDPLLQGTNPGFWKHTDGLRKNYTDVTIHSPTTKAAFSSLISREIKHCGLDYRSRLVSSMKAQYGASLSGEHLLNEWVRQFSKMGVESYGEDILRCMEVLSEGELRHLLSLDRTTKYCVLSKNGSDRSIIRQLDSCGNLHQVRLLSECLDHVNTTPITLLVDSVHSGSQLIEEFERCLNKMIGFSGKIVVKAAHLTTYGTHKVKQWLQRHNLESIVDLDFSNALKVENITSLNAQKQSELELRLNILGHKQSYIEKAVGFCRKIGATLKQTEDHGDYPDLLVGLGGFSLGLTSMIGFPGKGVLPVLRLSGPVKFDTHKLEWKALFSHGNTSGAG